MLAFLQLMGLKRILFLMGLILYVVVIFILLCLPEKKRFPKEEDELIKTNDKVDAEDRFTPKDAPYCATNEPTSPSSLEFESTGSFNRLVRKKSRSIDSWNS